MAGTLLAAVEFVSWMHGFVDALAECRDCGLLQRVPKLPDAKVAVCARCDARLSHSGRHGIRPAFSCACLGLLLFGLAYWLPLASVSMPSGRFAASNFTTGPRLLADAGFWGLSLVVVLTLLILPAHRFVASIGMTLGVWIGRVPAWTRRAFAWMSRLDVWAMVDVFLLGAMIALIRLEAWMHVDFGLALAALLGVVCCSVLVERLLDRSRLWASIPRGPYERLPDSRLVGCGGCGLVSGTQPGGSCPRCGSTVHARKPDSVNRTWALIAAAALFAVPANILPVMTVSQFGAVAPSTIMGGTVELAERGFWVLALIVFVASILVPLLKLVVLVVLLITTSHASRANLLLRTRLYRAVAWIGRWSMLDIFATMTLVMLARFAWVGSVYPNAGATAFCAVVVFTMLASETFDPRLMWDAAGRNAP